MKSSLVSPTGAARRCARPPRHAARSRTLWRLRCAKSSRETAERGRGRPKRRGRARAAMWRRRDDRSALSVSLRLSSGAVARRVSRSTYVVGILDLSLFLSLSLLPFFPSYFSLSLSRPGLPWRPIEFAARSTTVATFPRAHARARDVKTIVRNERARTKRAPRFVSVKGNAISSG